MLRFVSNAPPPHDDITASGPCTAQVVWLSFGTTSFIVFLPTARKSPGCIAATSAFTSWNSAGNGGGGAGGAAARAGARGGSAATTGAGAGGVAAGFGGSAWTAFGGFGGSAATGGGDGVDGAAGSAAAGSGLLPNISRRRRSIASLRSVSASFSLTTLPEGQSPARTRVTIPRA